MSPCQVVREKCWCRLFRLTNAHSVTSLSASIRESLCTNSCQQSGDPKQQIRESYKRWEHGAQRNPCRTYDPAHTNQHNLPTTSYLFQHYRVLTLRSTTFVTRTVRLPSPRMSTCCCLSRYESSTSFEQASPNSQQDTKEPDHSNLGDKDRHQILPGLVIQSGNQGRFINITWSYRPSFSGTVPLRTEQYSVRRRITSETIA